MEILSVFLIMWQKDPSEICTVNQYLPMAKTAKCVYKCQTKEFYIEHKLCVFTGFTA